MHWLRWANVGCFESEYYSSAVLLHHWCVWMSFQGKGIQYHSRHSPILTHLISLTSSPTVWVCVVYCLPAHIAQHLFIYPFCLSHSLFPLSLSISQIPKICCLYQFALCISLVFPSLTHIFFPVLTPFHFLPILHNFFCPFSFLSLSLFLSRWITDCPPQFFGLADRHLSPSR